MSCMGLVMEASQVHALFFSLPWRSPQLTTSMNWVCSPIDLFHTTFAPSAKLWHERMNRICVQASVLLNRSLEFLWKYITAIHLTRALILDYLRCSLDADVEIINRWRQTQSQRFSLSFVLRSYNKEAVTSLIVLFFCPDWVLNRYQQNCVGGHFLDNEVDHFRR